MNQNELRKALLQLDTESAASDASLAELSKTILNRDRRRVRFLTILTIGTWALAGVMILFVLAAFIFEVVPNAKTLTGHMAAGTLTSEQTVGILHTHTLMFLKGAILIAFSVSIMAFAALLTVVLIFVSRRATLRQVTINLAKLAEQLKCPQ
jgi:hypothetical protein